MNLLNKLTIKNLKLNKKRTIVTIIGIMLSVALITVVSSIYSSGIKSLIKYETYEKGNFHAAFYKVPVSDIDIFENNRNIETINITKDVGFAKIDSKNEYKPYACIKGFTKNSLNNLSVKLLDGRLPKNENEIVIPTHLKTNGRLFLNIGDSITLDVGKRVDSNGNELDQNNPYQESNEEDKESIIDTTSKTYKIVGIIGRPATNIENYSAPGYTFITYIYVGLKKDKAKQERTDYKDKFISPELFQWESENNTTRDNNIGIKLLKSNKVYLFVRKMDDEDNIILPFTYFGTGKFENVRDSKVIDKTSNDEYKTLLFDIRLDNVVPEEYHIDFEIPEKVDE